MKEIRHIGVVVSNLDRAIHFYRDLLGFKVIREMNEEGNYIDTILSLKNVIVRTVKMKADDGNIIELLYFKLCPKRLRNKNLVNVGYSHFALTVDNIDEEYERLKRNGVIFNSPPEISPDGYAKVAFCKDPDGAFIELVEVLKK